MIPDKMSKYANPLDLKLHNSTSHRAPTLQLSRNLITIRGQYTYQKLTHYPFAHQEKADLQALHTQRARLRAISSQFVRRSSKNHLVWIFLIRGIA